RLRKVAVIARRGGGDLGVIVQLARFSQQRQPAGRLHIGGAALAHQQRTSAIGLQVMGVLGDAADQQQGPSVAVQAIRHYRTERKPWDFLRMRGEYAAVFLEQQFSGILGGLYAHLMTPREDPLEADGCLE